MARGKDKQGNDHMSKNEKRRMKNNNFVKKSRRCQDDHVSDNEKKRRRNKDCAKRKEK